MLEQTTSETVLTTSTTFRYEVLKAFFVESNDYFPGFLQKKCTKTPRFLSESHKIILVLNQRKKKMKIKLIFMERIEWLQIFLHGVLKKIYDKSSGSPLKTRLFRKAKKS